MTDYHEFVEMIAENGLRLGENPRTVARACIVIPEQVDDEQTVRFAAEPFVDDPVTQTRLWPKDVITGTDRTWSSMDGDTLREIAVEILKADVYEEMMAIENKTEEQVAAEAAARAEIEAERRLDERRERHFDEHGHFGPGRPDPGPD